MAKRGRPFVHVVDMDAVRGLLSDGMHVAAIARQLGHADATIWGRIARLPGLRERALANGNSFKRRREGRFRQIPSAELHYQRSLWQNPSLTLEEIAEQAGVPAGLLKSRANTFGWGPMGATLERRRPVADRLPAVPFERLAEKVVRPGIEKHLTSLLKFRGGNTSLGRMHRMWNFVLCLKEHEVENTADAVNLAKNEAFAHLCEPPGFIHHTSLVGFLNRLALCPDVCALEPGMRDYARLLSPRVFQLTRVSYVPDFKEKAVTNGDLDWPLLAHDPVSPMLSGDDIVAAINKIVPRTMPDEQRADICQDLIMGVLEGKWTLDNIRDNPKKHIAAVREMSPWKYKWLSLDAPIFGDGDQTLHEVMAG